MQAACLGEIMSAGNNHEPSWWKQMLAVATVAAVVAGAYFGYHEWHVGGPGEADGMAGMQMEPGGNEQNAASKKKPNESEVPGHAVAVVSPRLQQRIGLTVARVERKRLKMSVRAVGIVRPDETRLAKIHLKTEGWVDKLFVNYIGQKVEADDRLLAIYSPQFLTAQSEFLTSRRARDTPLAELARRKLELLDVPDDEIEELEKTGKPRKDIVLRAPIDGTVLKRDAFEDQYVTAEKELYEIADLSVVWVQAKIYEYELPHVHLEQPATVTLEALPERELTGKVVFLQPVVAEPTRTVEVRVELPNPEGELRPGMFADIRIDHDMGEGLLVAEEAVIRTGEHTYAFREAESNRFEPVKVSISPLVFNEHYQVLEGLKEGDRVVTSANFLVDSESRLRLGGGMGGMAGMDMSGMKMDGGKKDADMKDMDMNGMDMNSNRSK